MPSSPRRRLVVLLVLAVVLGTASRAAAASKTCGASALANTTTVLCTSGTCNATLVNVTDAIEVTTTGCEFDLGGRALTFTKTFQMNGKGFIRVINAGPITLTTTGKLKATGDFVKVNGKNVQGGLISLTSSGDIVLQGSSQIDVTGDSAGMIRLIATGNVNVGSNTQILGTADGVPDELGMIFSDGGELDVVSSTGDITLAGVISLKSANAGTGGVVDLTAARSITVSKPVDVSGGSGDGGEFTAFAGDHVTITGNIDADSKIGGGFGGVIDLTSGADEIGPAIPPAPPLGGSTTITGASLLMRGSSGEQFGGDGGELSILALGNINIGGGASMIIRLDAGSNLDGSGGSMSLDSGDFNSFTLGPVEGDINLGGSIFMTSGSTGGDGGSVDLSAGRDLFITADIIANGIDAGGEIDGTAGRKVELNGALTADGTTTGADGGFMSFESGTATDEGNLGVLIVKKDLQATSGATNTTKQGISLSSCALTVSPSVKIDGTGGTFNGVSGGASIDLISKRAMQLQSMSKYTATPGGTITTIHPSGANPVIGTGVTFNPGKVDSIVATGPYPNCPVCGDNVRSLGEVCDKGAGADGPVCCNTTCSQYFCVTPTPTPTPTRTRTPTPSRTPTPTRTVTPTVTVTGPPVLTVTPTATTTTGPVTTATITAGAVVTATPTVVATSTPTATATLVVTATPSATRTATPTVTTTRTTTPTPTPTVFNTATATSTAVPTLTATPSPGPTSTGAPSLTPTATTTATQTAVPTATPTVTATVQATATPTATVTVPATATPTATATTQATGTPTATATTQTTATPTATATTQTTATPTASATATTTGTATLTPSTTPTPSRTPTPSTTPSIDPSPTLSATRSPVATATPTLTAPPPTASPTLSPTPGATPTVECGQSCDQDGDGVRDDADNCPTVANADQADFDNDGDGNPCDSADADLDLRRGRVRGGKPDKGEILAKGEFAIASGPSFDPTLGLEVQVVDTLMLDRSFVFAPGDCRAFGSGRVTCKTADGRWTARFDPLKARGRMRFGLRFQKLTITEPFAPALLVRITTDPGDAELGIDRVGSLATCRVTPKALLCVAK